MKNITKKLTLRAEIVRGLSGASLHAVAGGAINRTNGGCIDPTDACGGDPSPTANFCLKSEFTCR